ncbi:ComEA family DNA-binding protein [Botrimarina hoheduenensis]|uniref:ComE operon protein 1 n=1 Tax=Botrimarina hoheduenensis TaxID=2528000 RepID=A0A5C5VXF2_9BACT|nr:helix-hairpin-helix domain-containing protein [Botrimarina hoheduenensis]TWT43318.1 ComE operon protein 1 [Botrimarina hoheduenensis]
MASPLLRRADQLSIAVLTGIVLAGIVAWWIGNGGHRGELITIDNAPPLEYRFLVNLNEAAWPELAQLPGVGETLAKRIVASRNADGAFRAADDLRRVNGIGPRKLDAVRRYLLPLADEAQVAHEAGPPASAVNAAEKRG